MCGAAGSKGAHLGYSGAQSRRCWQRVHELKCKTYLSVYARRAGGRRHAGHQDAKDVMDSEGSTPDKMF